MGNLLKHLGPRWSFHIAMPLEEEKIFSSLIIIIQLIVHIFGGGQRRGFLVQKSFIPKIKNDKGQSTIEFILTFAFAIGISFLFVAHALNMTTGFLTHYATFMAGRAFMTYDANSNEVKSNLTAAKRVAIDVFNIYRLDRFGVQSNSVRVYDPPPYGSKSVLFSGVTAEFEKRLTPYKLVGGSVKATMLSEGFLGKEPLKIECWEMTCRALGLSPSNCGGQNTPMDVTVYDNGC